MRQDNLPLLRPSVPVKVLVVALGTTLLLSACNRADAPAGDAPANDAATSTPAAAPNGATSTAVASMTITTATVESQPLARTVPATGSVYPWQDVIISAEVGGYRVAEVLVDVGARVTKGQPLVRLATDMLQADLESRRAALRSAEATETNAAAALRRGEAVQNSGALSAADFDRLKAEHIAAQARVETARADLTTAELRLRYGTVVAPDSGTITARNVSVGQIAQAGSEMLRLLRQNRVEWRAEVPEAQLSRIRAGQRVKISAADGSVIQGTVRTVAPTVQTINRTGLVYVDITGGNARPGVFARGTIETGTGPGLLVPVASVVVQDGYSYVFVVKADNTVERRRITQAGVYGENLEVAEGVTAGERVAVKGAGFLKDGDTVAVAEAAA